MIRNVTKKCVLIIIGGEQSLWWSRPGYVMCDTSICHNSWDIEISWVLNGFPPFFCTIDIMYYVTICNNKLKAQINVYLSRKMPKTWKYGTNCSFSPHQSTHVSWVKVLMGIVAVNIPMAFKTSPKNINFGVELNEIQSI